VENITAAGSSSPRRARLIVPVWGQRYAARFTELTLPALLAPGNLPHLAAALSTEAVVVTQRELFDVIRAADSFRRLEKYCEVRLVSMDDLMSYPAYYGLTITWSLFRGFTDLGAAMTDTWLLFLNSDFILADGSYRSLLSRLSGDSRIVLAPSYCTIEEEVLPLLRQRLDQTAQTLAIPPREMADLMLDRLHYTVRAKTINRRMYRIEHADQLYHVVDNDTILCRQFPIAIVAMRPQRVLTDPVAIWDYGTISEACPTSPLSVIADSDEFLMLELRGRNVACERLELGWLKPSTVARDLSTWTTADQRRCSEHTLILHRADLPPNLEQDVRSLAEFHAQVMAEMRPDPLPHRDHPIWTRLLTLHHEWRAAGGTAAEGTTHQWATQAAGSRRLRERIALGVRGLYRAIFGRIPRVRREHPYWIDIQPTLSLVEHAAEHTRRAIAVFSTPRAVVAPWLSEWFDDVRRYETDDIAGEGPPPDVPDAERVDFCFAELTREEMLQFRRLHARLRAMVRPGGHIVVLYRTHGVEVLAPRDISFIVGALPVCDVAVVWYRGGRLAAGLQRTWDEMLAGMRRRRRIGAARFVVTSLLAAPITWFTSRAGQRRAGLGEVPRGCTSVLMDITVL
jgi:hypothetical protein